MSLLFNTLSRFITTFLPRSKYLWISWLQSPSVLILEPPKINSLTISTFSPSICHEVMRPDAMILVSECWLLSQLFHSPISLSSRGSLVLHFLPSGWFHLHIWGYWFLQILIPACPSSSPAFLMMYSAYKLNKQGDSIQPWNTPFSIWNQSVVSCPVLTVVSWPAYRFLKS